MVLSGDTKKNKDSLRSIETREAESLAEMLAGKYGIPYLNLRSFPIDTDALKIVDETTARSAGIAVVAVVGKKLRVAVKNPETQGVRAVLESLERKGYVLETYLGSLPGLEHIWERYKETAENANAATGIVDVAEEHIAELKEKITDLVTLGALVTETASESKGVRATDLLEIILAGALALDASDVHLESQEARVVVRYRLDGVLHEVITIPVAPYRLLLSRIKLLSEMKLNVHDRAQDGRFTIRVKPLDIEIRSSALPGPYGESLVMRVLNPKTINLTLEDLGMQPKVYEAVAREILKPNGMILTTGPTGSGKTTTLYAVLKKINSSELKIITIENPIEYHLEGVSQTQVMPGSDYTFENALQAILRQDPDVIMVGEIRSLETAETALHAALTGHLVFSTLHTNNAVGTLPRLIDMGVRPTIIAPAVNVAIAQRLLRKLCEHCKVPSTLTDEDKAFLDEAVHNMPDDYPKINLSNSIFTTKGCKECGNIGYKGRVGVYEILLVDDAVERLVLTTPSEASLTELARKQGMLTMLQDGVIKMFAGHTSMDELKRVVGE